MLHIGLKYKLTIICFIYHTISIVILTCAGEKIRFISMEHPNITYIDGKHILFANVTARRYGRSNPMYHVGGHFKTTMWLDKFLNVDFYFYEFLTNVYKRGFFEIHLNFCQLIKDKLIGTPIRQGNFTGPCPYPPGEYHLYNMTISGTAIPRGFPFTKGRVYGNATYKNVFIASGYLDIEIKEANIKRKKERSN